MPSVSANHPQASQLLDAEIAADAARIEHHRRDQTRHRGVTWSGLGPSSVQPRSPEVLRAKVESSLAARQLWQASPEGQLTSAISACQLAARNAHALAEQARAGAARGEPIEWRRAVLRRLSGEARDLLVGLRQARRALSG